MTVTRSYSRLVHVLKRRTRWYKVKLFEYFSLDIHFCDVVRLALIVGDYLITRVIGHTCHHYNIFKSLTTPHNAPKVIHIHNYTPLTPTIHHAILIMLVNNRYIYMHIIKHTINGKTQLINTARLSFAHHAPKRRALRVSHLLQSRRRSNTIKEVTAFIASIIVVAVLVVTATA